MNQNESDIINKNQPIRQYKKTFLINFFNNIKNKNYHILNSIYTSKVFTKYALYNLLIYKITQNKYMGAVAFNCNSAAFLMFNYIRFIYPDIFNKYKKYICEKYNFTNKIFILTDFCLHTAPFTYIFYTRNNWLYDIPNSKLLLISTLSYSYELLWAYYYANGIDVSKIYEIDKINVQFSNNECKQMWIIIAFFHYLSFLIKNIPKQIRWIKKI